MIDKKLEELGITLPQVPKPLAAYIPGVQSGNMIFTSGQLPMENGAVKYTGKVGGAVELPVAQAAAELAALNTIGVAASIAGSVNNIKRILKLTVFVNCVPEFTQHPEVANGASELMLKIFGEAGKHARAAVGVGSLPRDASVEVELIAEI